MERKHIDLIMETIEQPDAKELFKKVDTHLPHEEYISTIFQVSKNRVAGITLDAFMRMIEERHEQLTNEFELNSDWKSQAEIAALVAQMELLEEMTEDLEYIVESIR
jgi:hypothetical protein